MEWSGPIVDNHCHLGGPQGRGIEAVEDFVEAGGTHLIVINKPSWSFGVEVETGRDFRHGFEATCAMATEASTILPGKAWAILGVHPALISRLVDDRGMSVAAAGDLMREGITVAAEYVRDGRAIGLKSGRPHYPVDDAVWTESNAVMAHAFEHAASIDCAVQLHTEEGTSFDDITTSAEAAGLSRSRVVKHFAEGPVDGPVPSVIARKEALIDIGESDMPFLMETDYLDDPDRPGAVLGPKTIPRRVRWLAQEGYQDALAQSHVHTPEQVYDIEMAFTDDA